MERRRRARPHATASGIDLPEQQISPFLISAYPNIDQFTEHGQIVIGPMEPVGGVAIAADGREPLPCSDADTANRCVSRSRLLTWPSEVPPSMMSNIDEVNTPRDDSTH